MNTRILPLILLLFGLNISHGQHKFTNVKIKNFEVEIKTNSIEELKEFDWKETLNYFKKEGSNHSVKVSFTLKRPKINNQAIIECFKRIKRVEGLSFHHKLRYGVNSKKIRAYTFSTEGKSKKIDELIALMKNHITNMDSFISS